MDLRHELVCPCFFPKGKIRSQGRTIVAPFKISAGFGSYDIYFIIKSGITECYVQLVNYFIREVGTESQQSSGYIIYGNCEIRYTSIKSKSFTYRPTAPHTRIGPGCCKSKTILR